MQPSLPRTPRTKSYGPLALEKGAVVVPLEYENAQRCSVRPTPANLRQYGLSTRRPGKADLNEFGPAQVNLEIQPELHVEVQPRGHGHGHGPTWGHLEFEPDDMLHDIYVVSSAWARGWNENTTLYCTTTHHVPHNTAGAAKGCTACCCVCAWAVACSRQADRHNAVLWSAVAVPWPVVRYIAASGGLEWCSVVPCDMVCDVMLFGRMAWRGVVCRRRCYQRAKAEMSTHGYR